MAWSQIYSSGDVVAIHAALVPTENGDGEIIMFGGDNHEYAAAKSGNFDHAARFNCRNPDSALIKVHSPDFDVFCCGHAFLGDGRLLIAGGTAEYKKDAKGKHHEIHFDGHPHCAIYDSKTGAFTQIADMTAGGRWYPNLCTIENGEVFVFQGHPGGDDQDRHGNNMMERYNPFLNHWKQLGRVGDVSVDPILYPRMHLINSGEIFISSKIQGYNKNLLINPWTGAFRELSALPGDDYSGFNYPSVLLPLTPEDGYRPRILLCGSEKSLMLDLGNPGAGWGEVKRAYHQSRIHSCATILPTGDVLLTGGTLPIPTKKDPSDMVGEKRPEIFRTPIDTIHRIYKKGAGQWETIEEPATILRNYHSTALLLPDGRVWTAGGTAAGQPYDRGPGPEQEKIEIYAPPYPAGPRPTITSCPSVIDYGERFLVQTPAPNNIGSVILMRCGSSTHAFDCDQRAVYMKFHVLTGSDDTLDVLAPLNGRVAPPGWYMLFIVDKQGRPCTWASFVRCEKRIQKFEIGSTVSALQPRQNHIDLFATDHNGTVWSTWWEPAKAWQDWFPIHPDAKMNPGATVTALNPRKNHIDLFATGKDGAVWSTFWESDRISWRNWFPIHPEMKMHPGSTVSALQPRQNHIDLFVTDNDGTVWSTWWERNKAWQGWFPIHPEVKMNPGATVTVLNPRENHIDLFATDKDGTVWSTWWEPGKDWQGWFQIHPEVKMYPGSAVSALQPRQDHIDLFVTNNDGAVWSTWWEPNKGWQGWFLIHPEVTMKPGGTVTVLNPRENHIDLFATGKDGTVWSTWWERDHDWQGWFPIHPEVKMNPGATVTALKPRQNHIDLFVTGKDGAVWSTWWESDKDWQGWFII